MERKLAQPTFTDALMLDYGSPRMARFFAEMQSVIPFEELAAPLRALYADGSVEVCDDAGAGAGAGVVRPRKGGRPHPVPICPQSDLRNIYYGLLGPKAQSITYVLDGQRHTLDTIGAEGAYMFVTRASAHQLLNFERQMDWFRFWLRGEEDPTASKQAQYRRWRQLREMVH